MMEMSTDIKIANDATSQYDRWLQALEHGYAKVDEHSFSEMLEFSVKFGGLINFFNLQDKVDGDWVHFFQTDPGMVIATIEAIDLNKIKVEFSSLLKQVLLSQKNTVKFDLLISCFELIANLARQLNDWLCALDLSYELLKSTILQDNLRQLIDRNLIEPLDKLASYAEGAGQPDGLNKKIELDFSNFLPVWKFSCTRADSSIYHGESKNKKIDNATTYLNSIFESFYYTIVDLKLFTQIKSTELNNKSKHHPQVALFMAFAKLYHQAQKSINTISQRYIDFYYSDVLKEKQQSAIADSVYLNFTMEEDDESGSTVVPVNTLFNAGLDDNDEEIIYQSNEILQVSSASITQIKTLQVDKGNLFVQNNQTNHLNVDLKENKQKIQQEVARKIISSNIIVNSEPAYDYSSFPLFGELNSNNDNAELAQLGFAIASNYLFLSSGVRDVSLNINLTKAYYQETLVPLLYNIEVATGKSQSQIFYQVLNSAFTLYASTSQEWFEIESYNAGQLIDEKENLNDSVNEVSQNRLSSIFRVSFLLSLSAPPIIPCFTDEEIEEGENIDEDGNIDFLSPLPALKFYLKQKEIEITGSKGSVKVYPLSLLEKMEIDGFDIKTKVTGFDDIKIENTDGEVDITSPFLVFGGFPVVNSYLQISQKEFFIKTPDELSVSIEWFNLPQNEKGFNGYYQYYDIGLDGKINHNLFNNQTFCGQLSIVNPGSWILNKKIISEPDEQLKDNNVYLFRSENKDIKSKIKCLYPPDKSSALCSSSYFNMFKVDPTIIKDFSYYEPSNSAIKIELTKPSYGFGNDLYAKNVLNAVIDDLPDVDKCKEECLCDSRPLKNVIENIQSCFEICLSQNTTKQSFICILEKLLISEAGLWAAIVQCLLQEAEQYKEAMGKEIWKSMQELFKNYMQLAVKERLEKIKWCLQTFKNFSLNVKEKENSNNNSWDKCQPLYDTAILVLNTFECVKTCYESSQKKSEKENEDDKSCMEKCLQSNLDKIQLIYDNYLTECMNGCMKPEQELKYPNEPYLPQATKVTVNYNASCQLFSQQKKSETNSDWCHGDFYHLLPFDGYKKVNLLDHLSIPLLPAYKQSGNLYIGFSNLLEAQRISLFFNMSDSKEKNLPSIQWDVLSSNQWQCLPTNDIDSDTTNHLQNVGIVSLNVSKIDSLNNTIFNTETNWLRASVKMKPDYFPLVKSIMPHALLANLCMANENEKTIVQSLPAHTITSSVDDLPNISEINQPMKSFGGRCAENYQEFEVRVGERLRHKKRAILSWDYERLILERFPEIWQVKTFCAHDQFSENSPGNTLLVVIPASHSIDCLDPTAPTVNNVLLQEIYQYLIKRSSLFLKLHVSNPVYVRIEVKANVIFDQQSDPGHCSERLNDELIRYLSPWFYDEKRAEKKGNYISQADISAFIQSCDYVDSLTSIDFVYSPDINKLQFDWCYLTSAKKHDIQIFQETSCLNTEFNY